MEKLHWWLITLIFLTLLILAVFVSSTLSLYSNNSNSGNTVLPYDYYELPVEAGGIIICAEPKSNSDLYGLAEISGYPLQGKAEHYIIVMSTANLTREDLARSPDPEQDAQKLEKLSNSLESKGLLHLHYSKDKKMTMDAYIRNEGSWTDVFKFWKKQFDKEWKFLETWSYVNEKQASVTINLTLKRIYGMDCRLITQ